MRKASTSMADHVRWPVNSSTPSTPHQRSFTKIGRAIMDLMPWAARMHCSSTGKVLMSPATTWFSRNSASQRSKLVPPQETGLATGSESWAGTPGAHHSRIVSAMTGPSLPGRFRSSKIRLAPETSPIRFTESCRLACQSLAFS